MGNAQPSSIRHNKNQKIPIPESLEAKFKLLSMLPYDQRARRKHFLVFGFILDWYHSKYGDALASVRHIAANLKERDPAGKGLYVGDVHSAISDLVAWGFLTQDKGRGRRASRYVPAWGQVCSVRETPNTTVGNTSVRASPNTGVRESPNTTAVSVRDSTNEDPPTPTRSLDPGTEIGGYDCAAPTAPSAPAADAPGGPDAAQEGGPPKDADLFEALWKAYGVRRDKAGARAVYARLAPNPEQHAGIVDAAKAWREAWAEQGRSDAPRKGLRTWLAEELFDCDPPVAYRQPARARKNSKRVASEKASHASTRPSSSKMPEGRRVATVVASEVLECGTSITIALTFEGHDGVRFGHHIVAQDADEHTQAAGQKELNALCHAVGKPQIKDSSELHGLPCTMIVRRDGSVTYFPIASNDNQTGAEVLAG